MRPQHRRVVTVRTRTFTAAAGAGMGGCGQPCTGSWGPLAWPTPPASLPFFLVPILGLISLPPPLPYPPPPHKWRPECPERFSGNQPQGGLSCLAPLLGDERAWRHCPAQKPEAPSLPAGRLLGGLPPRHGGQSPPLLSHASPLRGLCGQFPHGSPPTPAPPRPPHPCSGVEPGIELQGWFGNFIWFKVLCGRRAWPQGGLAPLAPWGGREGRGWGLTWLGAWAPYIARGPGVGW